MIATASESMTAKAGRLTLVKLVLTIMPLHQLEVLGMHKKTQKQMDKILRGFL